MQELLNFMLEGSDRASESPPQPTAAVAAAVEATPDDGLGPFGKWFGKRVCLMNTKLSFPMKPW